jgi:hypothetical protein
MDEPIAGITGVGLFRLGLAKACGSRNPISHVSPDPRYSCLSWKYDTIDESIEKASVCIGMDKEEKERKRERANYGGFYLTCDA